MNENRQIKLEYCPICGNKNYRSGLCPVCGYDLSTDYTRFSTLGKILANTKGPEALRAEYLKRQQDESDEKDALKKQIEELKKHQQELEEQLNFLYDQKKQLEIKQEIRTDRKQKEFQSLGIGQTYRMGRYQGEEITWKVLAVEEDKALLISEKVLDAKKYNESRDEWKKVTWRTCTLRKWLNTDFLNSAFTVEDREKIMVTKVRAEKNPDYNTNPGFNTRDKVFLLSIQEAEKYFADEEERKAWATDFAKKKDLYVNEYIGGCYWWLRSPGEDDELGSCAACVNAFGDISSDGYLVRFCGGVRPALWVKLYS